MAKRRILFLGTHNSVRSQMAEGLLRSVAADHYEILSAGLYPTPVDILAIDVMSEIGIDISRQESKDIQAFLDVPLFAVVTLCDEARGSCPKFSSECKYLHWKFQDPTTITGSRRERLAMFRLLRDEIAGRRSLASPQLFPVLTIRQRSRAHLQRHAPKSISWTTELVLGV